MRFSWAHRSPRPNRRIQIGLAVTMLFMKTASENIRPLTLRANALWNAIGCLFYLGCQWLTTVLVVRLSSSYENSGALAFAMANGIIFASIGLYKIRTFQVSDLNKEYSAGDYVGFRFVSIALGLLWSAIYLPLSCGNDFQLLSASLAYLLFKADEVFSDVLYGVDQRAYRMDFIGKSQIMRGFLSLLGFALPLCLFDNLVLGILGMALCCISVTILYDIPHARNLDSIRPTFSRERIVSLAKACGLAMLASLCANGIVSLVRQYFGITYGSEALGIYASVATPAVLIQVSATYLYSPMIGSLAQTLQEGGPKAFFRHFLKVLVLIVAALGVFIVALSLMGNTALQIVFGRSIAPYTYLFPYVLIATGCVGVLFYTNDVLVILRKTGAMLACNLVALVAALLLAIPQTAQFGMNGINFSVIGGCLIAVGLSIILITRSMASTR